MQGIMNHGMRNGLMRGMGAGMGFRRMRGMGQGMEFGMIRGMGQMPMDSTGWMLPMAPGRWMLESIPDVTENQKKQMADLNKKQIDEIKKVREEMFSKMQVIMDSHRKDILNILTDEQKNFIESRQIKPSISPEKGK